MAAPELRLEISTGALTDSFRVNSAGWQVATVSSQDWNSVLHLDGDAAGGGTDCAEAAEAAIPANAWTFAYQSSGANRGKFLWASDNAFQLDPNGEGLLPLLGFTAASYGSALSHLANRECDYIFTPAFNLANSPTLLGGGYQYDSIEAGATQTRTVGGQRQTIADAVSSWRRRITFTCLSETDVLWLGRFWGLARDGRKIRFFQDRDITNDYEAIGNRMGSMNVVFDEQTCQGITCSQTYNDMVGYYDVSLGLALWVAP